MPDKRQRNEQIQTDRTNNRTYGKTVQSLQYSALCHVISPINSLFSLWLLRSIKVTVSMHDCLLGKDNELVS